MIWNSSWGYESKFGRMAQCSRSNCRQIKDVEMTYSKISFTEVFPDSGVVDDGSGSLPNFGSDETKGIPVLQNLQKMDIIHHILVRIYKMSSRSDLSERVS